MDRGTARGYVALKAEDVNQTQWTATQYNQVINQAVRQFCIETRCYKNLQTTTPVAGTAEYSLPSDILECDLVRFAGLKLRPTTKYELSWQRGSDWTTATGTPTAYLIDEVNSQIWLVPQPDSNAVSQGSLLIDYSSDGPGDIADANDSTQMFGGRTLLQDYVYGVIAFSAYLLTGYITQTPEWVQKRKTMLDEYIRYRDQAIEKYDNMADIPLQLKGGRNWNDRVLNPSNNAFSG